MKKFTTHHRLSNLYFVILLIFIVTLVGCAPTAPSNLEATALSTIQIDLTWSDNSNNETGFKIERSTDGSNFTQIAQVNTDITSYSDKGLNPSTTYYYRVAAYNDEGKSSYSNVADATTAIITWSKTFGDSLQDAASTIQQTKDGGYIIAGYKTIPANGGSDMWIIKLDPYGTITWEKTFGEINNDQASSIIQTNDGGYILAGSKYSTINISDASIIKLDSEGNVEWEKFYGSLYQDTAFSIKQTSDGGYIVTGYLVYIVGEILSDAWIIKLDQLGNTLWEKHFGVTIMDCLISIEQTTDGGYITAGYKYSEANNYDVWIIKLAANGDVQWEKIQQEMYEQTAGHIHQIEDGNYIVSGSRVEYPSPMNMAIQKLDQNGNLIWRKSYADSEHSDYLSYALSIDTTSDNGYIVAGGSLPQSTTTSNMKILKLDINGDKIWEKTFPGGFAQTIHPTEDKGYIVSGYTNTNTPGKGDMWILKLDQNGEIH